MRKKYLPIGAIVAVAIPITTVVSCSFWDQPKTKSGYDLGNMKMGDWHSLFHVSGRSLPKIGTKFNAKVNGKEFSHSWSDADSTAKVPSDFLDGNAQQTEMIQYLVKSVLSSKPSSTDGDVKALFGMLNITNHGVKYDKAFYDSITIASSAEAAAPMQSFNLKTDIASMKNNAKELIEKISKTGHAGDVLFIDGHATWSEAGNLTKEKIKKIKAIDTNKSGANYDLQLFEAIGFSKTHITKRKHTPKDTELNVSKVGEDITTYNLNMFPGSNRIIYLMIKKYIKAGDIIRFNPTDPDFFQSFAYIKYSQLHQSGKPGDVKSIPFQEFLKKVFSHEVTATEVKSFKNVSKVDDIETKIMTVMQPDWSKSSKIDPSKEHASVN